MIRCLSSSTSRRTLPSPDQNHASRLNGSSPDLRDFFAFLRSRGLEWSSVSLEDLGRFSSGMDPS
jgi:hypothetical protein